MGQYFSAQQRFYRQMLMAAKVLCLTLAYTLSVLICGFQACSQITTILYSMGRTMSTFQGLHALLQTKCKIHENIAVIVARY